jgi:predicted DCC family thiol-disulfide oxidoreductase YuxK
MLRSIVNGWNEFFFKPQRATPVALFRILYGLLNIANLALLRPEWLTWFGTHAYMSMETMGKITPGPRLDLFILLPQTDFAIETFFWVFMACAISLTLGFMTRFSCAAVYLCLMAIHERNVFILNGADTVMTVTGFFLMFAPAGGALSVDRLRRIWAGREGHEVPLYRPWAQRMIQLQISIGYISTFGAKMLGTTWRNGTAIYYVFRLDSFRRFPVPFANSLMVTKLLTWGTLVIEFSAGFLVWIRSVRYWVLFAAFLLHMAIEYSMNLPIFEWIMVSTYVTFIYPEDLSKAWSWICERLGPRLGAMGTVVYDGASSSSLRTVSTLRTLDVFRRVRFLDLHSEEGSAIFPGASGAPSLDRVRFMTPSGPQEGLPGLCAIAPLVPMLWPLAIPALFRGGVPRPVSAKE